MIAGRRTEAARRGGLLAPAVHLAGLGIRQAGVVAVHFDDPPSRTVGRKLGRKSGWKGSPVTCSLT